jgi:hypothetical protein
MGKVIKSVTAFRATFKVGDNFWRTKSCNGKPGSVSGPYRILQMPANSQWILTVETDQAGNQRAPDEISIKDITGDHDKNNARSDLLTKSNAAFTDKAGAQEYLDGQKRAFETDLAWQQQVVEEENTLRTAMSELETRFPDYL